MTPALLTQPGVVPGNPQGGSEMSDGSRVADAPITVMVASVEHNAEALVELLFDAGPLTSAECCRRLGWPKGRFDMAVRYARAEVCPALELTIPHPTPSDGWRYQVTDDWRPVEAGAAYSLGLVETRLKSVFRDVVTIEPHLERGSPEWRRANFLKKHLDHITRTLKEINDGEG